MGFGVLGTLEVVDDDGAVVDIAGGQPRLVLTMLLAAEGRAVPADALIDALWGDTPPASAAGTLQSYISRLRRALEPDRAPGAPAKVLLSEGNGYRLDVPRSSIDFRHFEALADEGSALLHDGRPAEAREKLVEAQALWRGPALADCPDRDLTRGLATRLEERRIVALEDRIDADLALGRHDALAGELADLVDQHPLRERLRAQLALARYRAGRQAEALRAIDDARRMLVEELGVDPGRALRDLERGILEQDPALDLPTSAARRAVAPSAVGTIRDDGAEDSGLVGRQTELDQLRAALVEARSTSRIVVLEGQPGIGKTRLAEELADEAARSGALVLWGRSLEGDAAPAFWPWLSVLRPLVADEGVTTGPRLAQLLGAAGQGQADPGGGARFDLFEDVVAAFADAGRQVVVVLDDVQWADLASLELLGFLAGRLRDEAVLIVATVRELEVGRNDAVVDALASIARRAGSRRIRVEGLGADDTAELLRRVTGHEVERAVATTIHARAEGNPFYATELAQLLAGVEGLTASAVAAAKVPASVRDVIRQRLARLPTGTLGLLQVCAVIGRDADLATVAAAAGSSLDRCLTDLEPAVLHRLLVETGDRPGTLSFVHALVREVVLDDVSSLRQARLHLAVADAVEGVAGAADDVAEILAEHLWAASAVGVGRRAADALQRAAGVAVRRMGYEAAEDLLSRCLQLRRATGSAEDAPAELQVILDLLGLRRARHGYAVAADDALVVEGRELATRLGDDGALLATLYIEWSAYDTACRYDEGTVAAERIAEVGADSQDPTVQHIVHQVWGIHSWHLGRITDARDHLDLVARVAPQPAQHSLLAVSSEMWMLGRSFATYIHDLAGDLSLDEVERRFDALAGQTDDPFLLSILTTFAAAGGVVGGDPERAARWAQRTLAADEGLDFAFWNGTARAYLGAALIDLGRHEEGLPLLDAGARHCVEHGVRTNYGAFVAVRAIGEVAAGRLEDASATVEEARRERATRGERWPWPLVVEAETVLGAAQGDGPDVVQAGLQRAAEDAVSMGALGMLRRLRLAAARLGVPPPETEVGPAGA